MTADVRRELAEALDGTSTGLWMARTGPGWGDTIAAALLPTVQRAEAAAYERGRREAAEYLLWVAQGARRNSPAVLDPAGADSGEAAGA